MDGAMTTDTASALIPTIEKLPASVRTRYSEKCQKAFMSAFNANHKRNKSQPMATMAGHKAAGECESS